MGLDGESKNSHQLYVAPTEGILVENAESLSDTISYPSNNEISSSNVDLIVENENIEQVSDSKFPPSIKYILGNEICERYSYYALRSILTNYLINFMGYSSKNASSIGHGFNAGAYIFTLVGAYISDGVLGKYKTILYFSILYCIGAAIFAITAIPGVTGSGPGDRSPWGVIIGLVGIAIGTGGIKPVVSAFCGDQFGPHQKKLLANLFQVFYWCVNLGSFFSTIISPILRTNVGYWCAFIVPSVILVIAIIVFVLGNNKYVKNEPQGSILKDCVNIFGYALKERIKKLIQGKKYNDSYYTGSFYDRAKAKYDPRTVEQLKLVARVLIIFIPLPFFWSLFDQTGTRWTIQANSMNRHLGSWKIDSEIINCVNPILVMIFVPIFEYGIYRPLEKRNINFSLLRKMGTGMFLSVIAFYISAIIQVKIDNSPPESVHITLQLPQYVVLTAAEVLLSITGLEFAYKNSPRAMKSIVMAGWLICVSIGNIFDAFVIELIELPDYQLSLLFGSVMFVFIFIFIIVSYRFKPIEQKTLDELNGDIPSIYDNYNKEIENATPLNDLTSSVDSSHNTNNK
ncbi:hypothetical protein DICPUDRAFT_98287 [Dictyostelium purpureum]|uniref:Uncharacterized protein n=1 Tax=Dictyostelium purpureum TaxID=5786 RepID=F0ZP80_DICPU|nr:uncharacterized protein DICPUDRAFT_98287 [Dictyostelium purpureum]EGC34258.1 hypothetical protein DICPUDRAFT_98287 [Dictyostelium purpureum]|eukprot:XP_003289227.1 hypothetical protein DICPUDRAFT_98287 [Dictyostelium purpureum]